MVADWHDWNAIIKEFAGPSTALLTVGSLALYAVGYLVLRFHLTTLGVGTDLSILDERYLFTGAQFLVYLAYVVPIAALIGLCLSPAVWVSYRLLRSLLPARAWQQICRQVANIRSWWSRPPRLAWAGIVLATLFLQFVMRQCLLFSNLLVSLRLPEPTWFGTLLIAETDTLRSLYFVGLVTWTALTGAIYWRTRSQVEARLLSPVLQNVFGFLTAVQLSLLPVNYGILIVHKMMPRVATLGGVEAVGGGRVAWLIWEWKEGVTYLVRGQENGRETRKLVTLLRSEVKRTEIIAYDYVLRVLFTKEITKSGALPIPLVPREIHR